MKKILNLCFSFILLFSFFIPFVNINAEIVQYAKLGVLTYTLRLRTEASTSSGSVILSIPTTASGSSYKLLETVPAGNGCVGSWYKIQYDTSTQGYVCSDIGEGSYIDIIDQDDSTEPTTPVNPLDYGNPQEDFAGYPVYIEKLMALKEKYPNWTFIPYKTGQDFNSAVNNQNYRAYIDGRSEGYRSTDANYDYLTDTFTIAGSEVGWYFANKDVIAYYMDPRNFLDSTRIMMFEQLSYNATAHTKEAVSSILSNTPAYTHADYYMNAASTYNISPLHLAARVRQESIIYSNGTYNFSISGTGGDFNCGSYSGSGIYNFFNIAAYGTCAAQRGLAWASGDNAKYGSIFGTNYPSAISYYGLPWNTPEKAIMGGAQVLSEGYINVGQNTLYFQKFNTILGGSIYHQYMTNVRAPYSEAYTTHASYSTNDILSKPLTFIIPIYNNMPDQTTLPNPGNPNYYLKDLRINGETVPGFSYDRTTGYFKGISTNDQTITIDADTINNNATVTGTGVKAIEAKENNADNVFNITVTAENGKQMTYTINIVRENPGEQPSVTTIMDNSGVKYNDKYISGIQIGTNVYSLIQNVQKVSASAYIQIKDSVGNVKTNDSFKTGDTVTISSNNETKNYTVVIYGDLDGDGEITRVDLLLVQRQVFGYANLDGIMAEAANVDKQGSIDRVDLLLIQRKVFGYGEISQ